MAAPQPAATAAIVVEKLTKNVNEDHLREIFGAYGRIQDLDMPINRQFMTNRGTAYIMYGDAPSAEAAIAHMHEAQLDGAVLAVSILFAEQESEEEQESVVFVEVAVEIAAAEEEGWRRTRRQRRWRRRWWWVV
ncbi:hypothetical protein SLS56_001108 [Neofusicoccum ribis]|uniref:RRM domain-containing protein n=1 Tax=Neofusicoccum ribis TaxID=45134 RepID=A0ABR3TAG2_9PEZI